MTAASASAASRTWESARRSRIRAFRAGMYLLIVAEGEMPNPGYEVDIRRSPLAIFPPQYNLLWRQRPGIWLQVVVPYRHGEVFRYPTDEPTVTVHHADGQDQVEIQQVPPELAQFEAMVADRAATDTGTPGAAEAIGTSTNLEFDEAFADAVSNLPAYDPPHSDPLENIEVLETGALFGGIAGFHHLFVRVRRTIT